MKIEITCPQCKSQMRLAAENAGKQARCPVCATITHIPTDAKQVAPDPIVKPKVVPSKDKPKRSKPQTSTQNSNPTNRSDKPATFGLDLYIFYAIALGLGSIGSNFVCCGPYVGLPAACIGMMYVFISRSALRQTGFVLNGLGFMLNAGILVWRFW